MSSSPDESTTPAPAAIPGVGEPRFHFERTVTARSASRDAERGDRDIGDRGIPKDKLARFTGPFMKMFGAIGGVSLGIFLLVKLPVWHWRFRQTALFHRFIHGRAIDMMPIIGDERRLYQMNASQAFAIDLAGKKNAQASEACAPRGKSGTGTGSFAYATEDLERRETATKKEGTQTTTTKQQQQQQEEEEEEEEEQDVLLDMLQEATRPDSVLGAQQKIRYSAVDIDETTPESYHTAYMTHTLCWEDPRKAKERLRKAWSLVKPGGHLLVIDYGRPRWKWMASAVDWLESKEAFSLRLTLNYSEWMKENFSETGNWPAALDKRDILSGIRYTIALQKKISSSSSDQEKQEKQEEDEETSKKGQDR